MEEPKVLIVEDRLEMAELLAISLEDDDIDTVVAATGGKALNTLRDGGVDLVLLDLGLPDMDGLEVLERIHSDDDLKHVPVIVVTGREKMRDKVRAFELGAVDYINKPINVLDVQARIVASLRRSQKDAETVEDGQQQRRTEDELLRINRAVDSASDAVCMVDGGQRVNYVNAAFVKMFGETQQDLDSVAKFRTRFSDKGVWDEIWAACEEHGSFVGELDMTNVDGAPVIAHVRADAILDENDGFQGAVVVLTDIRQRKRLEEDLIFLANHDALTGLHNRQYFIEQLKKAAAAAAEGATSHLMYVDLDHFKVVNHLINHAAGDRFLMDFSTVLQKSVREQDVVARMGSDEFAVLLREMSEDAALVFARNLSNKLAGLRFKEAEQEFLCSTSIGLSPIHSGTASEEVLASALAASYQVKMNGGNGVESHRPDLGSLQQLNEHAACYIKVKQALEENRIEVWLQPVLPLKKEGQLSFEALVRLRDERGAVVSPDDFLPAAERFGILHQIDHLVLYRVIDLMREHAELRVSVNLSSRTLTDARFPELVKGLLNGSDVEPARIYFEITETTMIRNLELAKKNIHELQEFGCRFALDDFGKGVSSLGYLRDLPVDVLKIDGRFVEHLHDDEVDRAIVKAIVEISRILGRQTVAEYVSSKEALKAVQELGVDAAQGWYIHKPAEPQAMLKDGLEGIHLPDV